MEWFAQNVLPWITTGLWATAAGLFFYSIILGRRALKAQMSAYLAQNNFNVLTMQRQRAVEAVLLAKGLITPMDLLNARRDVENDFEDARQRSHLN